MKLSVIIPVYNVGNYIEKGILSLINQDLQASDYEIIAVDDCSTDDSVHIVGRLCVQYPNVRLIKQTVNGGPGVARNTGVDNASGDYIMFMDADDYLDPNVLGNLVSRAEDGNLDVLNYMCRGVDEQGEPIDWWCVPKLKITDTGIISGAEYIMRNQFAVFVTHYMFRRNFLLSNELRMINTYGTEDEEFTPRALALSHRMQHCPIVVYNYLQRGDSLMGGYGIRQVRDLIIAMDSLNRFVMSGVIRDKDVASRLRSRVSDQSYRAIKNSLRLGREATDETFAAMKKCGLLPLYNPRRSFNIFLVNHLRWLYVLFNSSKKKSTSARW